MEVKMFPLEPWQREVFEVYERFPSQRWVVVNSIRQVGKSTCLEGLLIAASLKEAGSFSLCVSPVQSQARKIFQDINRIAYQLIEKSNSSVLEITFKNESIIKFGSAESGDSLRGFTVKKSGILCVDEAAFQSDDVFYSILTPTTNVYQADIFIFSTPKFKKGFFYDLYQRGLQGDMKVISLDWTRYDTSKYLPKETLEIYRQQMPKLAFETEFLGKFIDGEGSVFTNFNNCVGTVELDNKLPVYIGCDWATNTGGDYTVFTIGQFDGNKIGIEKQMAFNDCNTTETIDKLIGVVKELAQRGFREINIIAEKNSLGQVYYSLLVEEVDKFQQSYNDSVSWRDEIEVGCSTFVTTNKSKETIIKQLMNCFEKELIVIPDDKELLLELGVYDCKINQNGTPTYNAPTSYHDDRCLSLAFLMRPLYSELR